MKFVYPAGLWALLALAVPALLRLARQRSEVTPVSSAYLWRLADQRRKKSRHLRRLKRLVFFLLQLASLLLAALLVAQPILTAPGAGINVAVILDASASMNLADESGETRFARAVAAAERDLKALPWGASVTVVLSGDEAAVIADHVSAGSELHAALENAACGWGEGDLQGALALCGEMLGAGAVSRVCLYTDAEYESAEGVEVVCVRGEGEWNVSIGALSAEGSIYGTSFETTVLSSGRSADVTFTLTVDGQVQPADKIDLRVNGTSQPSGSAYCPEGEETQISLLLRQTYEYSDASVTVLADDGLTEDNQTRLFRQKEQTARVLLVGENPYFWQSALEALPRVELSTATDLTQATLEGYDVYAFDGCLPEKLPTDGAVWLLNPPRSPREIGVVFGERLMGTYLSRANQESALAQKLTNGLALNSAAVARFYEITAPGALENVLMCGKMPVLTAGESETGCLLLVMPFDVQESNLPLLADFVVLVNNILEASAPEMLSVQTAVCGERVWPQAHPLSEGLFLQTPDMRLSLLSEQDLSGGVAVSMPGTYTLLQNVRGAQLLGSFFAQTPPAERTVDSAPVQMPLVLRAAEGAADAQPAQARVFHPARVMALLLLALLLAEWGMYHYERY